MFISVELHYLNILPQNEKMKSITDANLEFDEESHTYTYRGVELTSVTQFLSSFFPEFPEKKMAAIVARKQGKLSWQVLKEWKTKGEDACKFGTIIHQFAEDLVLKKKITKCSDEREQTYRDVVTKYFKEHPSLTPEFVELQLCVPALKLAGTLDMCQVSKEGKRFLYDWKTSKVIKQKGYPGDDERMLPPFEYLDNCNYVKYSFQLAIYKKIMEMKGKPVDGCYIIHLTEKGWKEYKCLDLSEEVEVLIQNRIQEVFKE